MPEIKIISAQNSSNSTELFLLEFQGKFESSGNVSFIGMEVGKLDLSGVRRERTFYLVFIFDSFFLL